MIKKFLLKVYIMPIKTSYVSNINNASGVYIDNPLSAFGDLVTTELTPVIQADFVHGINNKLFTLISNSKPLGS